MKEKVQTAIELFKEYKLDEAQEVFEALLDEDKENIEVLLHLGKIHSRTQNYGVALNYFNKAIELNPNNSEAKTGLVLINNILQLTNNFYFENAYTDDDLYESTL